MCYKRGLFAGRREQQMAKNESDEMNEIKNEKKSKQTNRQTNQRGERVCESERIRESEVQGVKK